MPGDVSSATFWIALAAGTPGAEREIEGVGLNFLIETKNKQLEGNRINYLAQYASGIEFMHKAGYMHRDICPRNVMVNKDGIVKIIDLGLAATGLV